MNRSWFRSSGRIFFALAVCSLAGCSTSPLSRIDSDRALYESWPIEVQSAVFEGRATVGMMPEMVRMALVRSTRVESRPGSTTGEASWIYEKGGGMNWSRPNISLGGTIGGVGVSTGGGGGRSRGSSTTEEQDVVFQNGVVTRVN